MDRMTSKPVADVLRNSYYPYFRRGGMVTSGKNDERILNPNRFSLNQNFPNPFNPSTSIEYSLEKRSKIKLQVFNSLGQKVRTLVNQLQAAGIYEVEFNSQNLTSGSYYYVLTSDNIVKANKMILVK